MGQENPANLMKFSNLCIHHSTFKKSFSFAGRILLGQVVNYNMNKTIQYNEYISFDRAIAKNAGWWGSVD